MWRVEEAYSVLSIPGGISFIPGDLPTTHQFPSFPLVILPSLPLRPLNHHQPFSSISELLSPSPPSPPHRRSLYPSLWTSSSLESSLICLHHLLHLFHLSINLVCSFLSCLLSVSLEAAKESPPSSPSPTPPPFAVLDFSSPSPNFLFRAGDLDLSLTLGGAPR